MIKKTFIITFTFFLVLSVYSQKKIKFVFFEDCNNLKKTEIIFSIVSQENNYNLSLSKDRSIKENIGNTRLLYPGKYFLQYNITEKDYYSVIIEEVYIADTTSVVEIIIPKILIRTSKLETDLNNIEKFKNYYYCNTICNGINIDYYKNNRKRTEGEFKKGKPVQLTKYNKYDKGNIKSSFNERSKPLLVEYYDKEGQLEKYKKYKYAKKKIYLKTYNSKKRIVTKEKFCK
jgi:antitoxin component YwqK of YwqJK toxin-antitoxin module